MMSCRRWGEELLQEACSSLAEEMNLDPSVPGGMVTYRRTLTLSLFYKFYLSVLQKLRAQVGSGFTPEVLLSEAVGPASLKYNVRLWIQDVNLLDGREERIIFSYN